MAASLSGPFYPVVTGGNANNSREHFFDEGQEKGETYGALVAVLKLGRTLTKTQHDYLDRGFTPDGFTKLARTAGNENRQGSIQIVFAAPKPFSTFVACADADSRDIAIECHKASVRKAVDYLQSMVLTRCGSNGEKLEPAEVLWVSFLHYDSRAGDPHIHTHVVLFTFCRRKDGSWGTIFNENIFCEIRAANAIYEAESAKQLKEKLGLKIKPLEVGGFEIEGVPNKLSEHFSSRRAAMDVELEKHNARSPEAQRIAALHTRQPKVVIPKEELFAGWQKDAKDFGFGPEQVRKLISLNSLAAPEQSHDFKKSFAELSKKTKQTNWHLTRAVRTHAIETGAGAKEVSEALRTVIPKSKKFIHVESKPVFKKAPFWSVGKLVQTPRIVIGNEASKWGNIVWEKKSLIGHIRIQKRTPFSKAPNFNPLRKLTLPALRFGKMRLRESELWGKRKFGFKILGGEFALQQRSIFPRALLQTQRNLKVTVPRFIPSKDVRAVARNERRIQRAQDLEQKKSK